MSELFQESVVAVVKACMEKQQTKFDTVLLGVTHRIEGIEKSILDIPSIEDSSNVVLLTLQPDLDAMKSSVADIGAAVVSLSDGQADLITKAVDDASLKMADIQPSIDASLLEIKDAAEKELGDCKEKILASIDGVPLAVQEAVDALPAPKDGESVTINDVTPLIEAEIASKGVILDDFMEAAGLVLDEQVAKSEVSIDAINPESVAKAVADAVADVPQMIADGFAEIPPAKNGTDVKIEDVKEYLDCKAVELIAPVIEQFEKDHSEHLDNAPKLLDELITKAVDALPKAKDGAGIGSGVINSTGELVLTLEDGKSHNMGRVVGKKGKKSKPGKDGFGFDSFDVEYDGERDLVFKFTRGEEVKAFPITLPVPIDRGVYKSGSYVKGDAVSFGGAIWIAQKDTTDKPGVSPEWRLAVKKGRDAKGIKGDVGDEGKAGKVGKGWNDA